MKSFKNFIKENKEEHLYMIHGGSDFDEIDPRKYGSGEPGNIRPLGKGLYGYLLNPDNEEESRGAIQWAKRYSQKYGGEKKALHIFKIPKTVKTYWAGQVHINLPSAMSPEEKEYHSALVQANELEGQERRDAFEKIRSSGLQDRAKKNPGNPQMKAQRLPIDQTEVSILDHSILKRVSKHSIDSEPEEILNKIR